MKPEEKLEILRAVESSHAASKGGIDSSGRAVFHVLSMEGEP